MRSTLALLLALVLATTALAAPPDAEALQLPEQLSLRRAVDSALARNVQTLLADARRDEAAGQRREARSAFLPHLSAEAGQSRQQINPAAQGLDIESALDRLGPAAGGADIEVPDVMTYNSFDARARLRQNLFDYSAWQRYQGSRVGETIAGDQLAVAREQVAAQAALDYVAAAASDETVHAARADLELAERLVRLAVDQENAGIATGVDVTRAKARRARAQARLAAARTQRSRARIRLARTAGLPLDAPLALSDDLDHAPVAVPPEAASIASALDARAEVRLAADRIAQGRRRLAAARGERLPTVAISAAYGESGNTYDENLEDTYSVGAQLQLPIFDGGAISAHIDGAASRLDQQRIRYRDTRIQVEQDVRVARRTLATLGDRVAAARAGLDLAGQELELARDRFAAGVSDNVEVVDAQAALAEARDTRVSALAEYARARINLAAALGRARQFSLHESSTP